MDKFLPLYVAGDLAGRRTARRVSNHLAACERCRGQLQEYEASRNLVRDAATLPPDFDGTFYAELRSSVLAEIKRGNTRLAPPAPAARFASLFNARFAYAASLAFIIVAVAALSLYSYVGRKSENAARPRNMIANTNHDRIVTPATTATPPSTQVPEDARQTLSPPDATAKENKKRELQLALSSSPTRRANNNNSAQNEPRRSVNLSKLTSSHVRRNSLAPIVGLSPEHTGEMARNGGGDGVEIEAAPEVSRIEIQTSDPNIRIIWLSPKPDAAAQPLK